LIISLQSSTGEAPASVTLDSNGPNSILRPTMMGHDAEFSQQPPLPACRWTQKAEPWWQGK